MPSRTDQVEFDLNLPTKAEVLPTFVKDWSDPSCRNHLESADLNWLGSNSNQFYRRMGQGKIRSGIGQYTPIPTDLKSVRNLGESGKIDFY